MDLKIEKLEKEMEEKFSYLPKNSVLNGLELIRIIAGAVDADWAVLWKNNNNILQPSIFWKSSELNTEKLERDTYRRFLSPGEGNAGLVLRHGMPIWVTDITCDMCLPRSLDAKWAGLTGGIWFAVKTETHMYGVVELLGQSFPSKNETNLLALERLGVILGQHFEKIEVALTP